ncbi:alpha-amylase family protein [Pontiella desulfatans]|nr:alpha-amylase family protein [Pontiella desulfatans]
MKAILVLPFSCLFATVSAMAWTGGTNEADWIQLTNEVAASRAQLTNLMGQADAAGLNTDYAYVSQVVIDRFQIYATYDYEHPEEVHEAFTNVWWNNKVPDPDFPINLPFDEMQSCLEVSSNAIAELQAQLATNRVLQAPVDFTTGTMAFGAGSCLRNGEPVFPSDFTWMPDDEDLLVAFGRMGGTYYALSDMSDSNTVKASAISSDSESLAGQTARNLAFGQYFIGHKAAGWMKEEYPEIEDGGRNFVTYDTDSPLIRAWFTQLFGQYIPPVCAAQGDQPRMHLLANEPNFATREGGWLAENGVSANTMDGYEEWISEKYATISNLNATYGTSYADFHAARNGMTLPIPVSLQGRPAWYDWCRFNMDRVNDFFQFLKDGAQGNDPDGAPATIKILGGQLANSWRDDGMDMEFLANLMDVTGADLHVVPAGATVIQSKLDMEWATDYALDWREQSMMLDFYKSLHPDKPYYDSEWHGFATGKWRHFSMDRDYVRSSLWLGFSHGMNGIQSWVWGRKNTGSFLDVNSDFIGDILTQPTALDAYGRVMKELNAHAGSVTALAKQERHFMVYYCGEAAIQDLTYVDGIEEVYEALKLLNLRVGFATPSTIGSLATSQAVVVPPTAFISDASHDALVAFEQSGGHVVLVNGASASFGTNELGFAVSGNTNLAPYAEVAFGDPSAMADDLGAALAPLKPAVPVLATVTGGASQPAYGVFVNQVQEPGSGETTLVLINVHKEPRTVALSLASGMGADYRNLVTGQLVPDTHALQPYDVLLLRTENSAPRVAGTIVQWGEPGGDDGIVTNGQDFSNLYNTYNVGNVASPLQGPDYYPVSAGRSPVFNHAANKAYNVKRIGDGGAEGDYINTAKNDADYSAMVVWENFIANHGTLESLEIETRVSNATDTPSQFRWLIQKGGTAWYASAQIDTTGSYVSYSNNAPETVDWYHFTPFVGGTASVGAKASIDLSDISAVGYHATFQQPGTVAYRASQTRYFKATASSAVAASGWDGFVSRYGLSGVSTHDQDGDGKSDLYEYALGGNPTNPADQGTAPFIEYHPGNTVGCFNLEVDSPVPGITYWPEWTDNLVTGSWSSAWNLETNHPAIPGYTQAERRLDGGTNNHLFFRLSITQP